MKKLTKLLLSSSDTVCQILFILLIFNLARIYWDTLAIVGGILLVLLLLYPKEYENAKNKILSLI